MWKSREKLQEDTLSSLSPQFEWDAIPTRTITRNFISIVIQFCVGLVKVKCCVIYILFV